MSSVYGLVFIGLLSGIVGRAMLQVGAGGWKACMEAGRRRGGPKRAPWGRVRVGCCVRVEGWRLLWRQRTRRGALL